MYALHVCFRQTKSVCLSVCVCVCMCVQIMFDFMHSAALEGRPVSDAGFKYAGFKVTAKVRGRHVLAITLQ